MPPSFRRKVKHVKKTRTLTYPNHHSSLTVQLQGHRNLQPLKEKNESLTPISQGWLVVKEEKTSLSVLAMAAATEKQRQMEQENRKLESLIAEKEVNVEDASDDEKSRSLSETQDGDSAIITDERQSKGGVDSGKVEETEDVSESVVVVDSYFEPSLLSLSDSIENAIKDAQVDNSVASDCVELELKKEKASSSPQQLEETELPFSPIVSNHHEMTGTEETELPPLEENSELSSVSNNEASRETEVVETIKNVTVFEETELPPLEENSELSSVSNNEASRETEVVETMKNVNVSEEKKSVLPSVVTNELLMESEEPNEDNKCNCSSLPPTDDVAASNENLETAIPISDEKCDNVPPTITEEAVQLVTEKSLLVPSTDEKFEKLSEEHDSSYETAKETFQASANVSDVESTNATVKEETEGPTITENPTNVSVTRRQYTSWRSCCGLFEVLRRGDR